MLDTLRKDVPKPAFFLGFLGAVPFVTLAMAGLTGGALGAWSGILAGLFGIAAVVLTILARREHALPLGSVAGFLLTEGVVVSRHELAELTEFAGMQLEAWDVTYWLEKFKQDRYSVSNEELRAYFPAMTVKEGLFALASQLYGVDLTPDDGVATWHKDVCYYKVSQNGAVLGSFYTDLFARNGKRTGAWIDECVTRESLNGNSALPVGYLVCNFPPPNEKGVSLLSHNDVVTLFHEFGHMLHHLLTRIGFPSISGINGVPWDAVELPSQFMENFAWSYDVLTRCSRHHEFGKPLPRDLFDKLDASRHAGAALAMLRQLELGLFDLRVHTEYDPANPAPVLDTLARVRDEVALIRHPDFNRLPHAFSHIFAGGYAAGYYSYKWAEVLAADAYAAFEEAGIFDADTASRFRREILEIGGSRDIMDAYVAFRGREPTIDEIAMDLEIDPDRVEELSKIAQSPVSLEMPVGEEDNATIGDFLEDTDVEVPVEAATFRLLQDYLSNALEGLNDREREVLIMRFGLENGKVSTLEEVGERFGVTRERIRQLETKALAKLRHPQNSRRLEGFLES